jgi:hypothetical protein
MFSFDFYNQSEIPAIYLANPDTTVLYNLGTIYDRNFELKYNALSTFTFIAPSQISENATDYYDSLQYRRLVYVDDIATFMITDIEVDNNGKYELKKVTCQSLEVVLSYKKLSLFEGTYTFNNTLSGSGVTTSNLMTTLISYVPGWTLGTIDSTLTNITRSFSITDKTLYDFMMNDVSQTYQCVFDFDTINKTISAYSVANATTPTDIYISFDNLMKSFTISESTNELTTAMNVLGGDGISINYVNPLGTETIYNFDYYKTTAWMTQDLIDAIDAWEALIASNQPAYANLLTSLRVENTNLITLESDLTTLQGELSALVVVRDARVQQGLDITDVSASIIAVSGSIVVKEAEIVTEEGIITGINTQLTSINSLLLFENNFTASQLSNLNNFIIGNTYTNTNFISTSLMSEVDVQNVSQDLYNQATNVLAKVSEPRYSFDIDAVNFLFIKDFQPFISQLSLGCTITIELSSGSMSAALLGIDFNYDDPKQFNMVLSNRMRLDDEQFQYSDLNSQTIDAGITTNFNSQKWNNTSDLYSSVVGTGNNIVTSTTTSNTGNIPLFYDTSGTRIRDGNVMYSSGSFTPSLVSASATFTYDYAIGVYNIIGKTMFFESSISLGGISGTTTNQVSMYLPLALHKNTTNLYATFRPVHEYITFGVGYSSVVGILPANSNSIAMYQGSSGSALSPLLTSALNASNTTIYLNGQYAIN